MMRGIAFNKFMDSTSIPFVGENVLQYVMNGTKVKIPKGIIVECGVYEGETLKRIAETFPNRKIYGCDSFEGLPEKWDRSDLEMNAGAFGTDGKMPDVPDNVVLIKGWFYDTMPELSKTIWKERLITRPDGKMGTKGNKIALLHVDCDLYSSTKCVFDNLSKHFHEDMVVVFDELLNYPGYENHEFLALFEYVQCHGLDVEWLAIESAEHQSVALKFKKKHAPTLTHQLLLA